MPIVRIVRGRLLSFKRISKPTESPLDFIDRFRNGKPITAHEALICRSRDLARPAIPANSAADPECGSPAAR
jgi:hypothetical protein